jgi:hypothetical protein
VAGVFHRAGSAAVLVGARGLNPTEPTSSRSGLGPLHFGEEVGWLSYRDPVGEGGQMDVTRDDDRPLGGGGGTTVTSFDRRSGSPPTKMAETAAVRSSPTIARRPFT